MNYSPTKKKRSSAGTKTKNKKQSLQLLLALLCCFNAGSELSGQENDPPLFVVRADGKEGFINSKGQIKIDPIYNKAYPFKDGLAGVLVDEKWGFIDSSGRMVIEPEFINIKFFSEGLAAIKVKNYTDPWGYIDKRGKIVIKQQFDCAGEFHNGIAKVGHVPAHRKLLAYFADVGAPCESKYIDKNGNYVKKPDPTHYASGKPDELIVFEKEGLYGYIDATGNVVIQPQFLAAGNFSDGLACVRKDTLYGFINQSGEWVIEPRFKYSNDFSEGLAGLPIGDIGWGFVDTEGNVVIPPSFGWIYGGFRDGIAEVAYESKIGYINKDGEWIWEPSE